MLGLRYVSMGGLPDGTHVYWDAKERNFVKALPLWRNSSGRHAHAHGGRWRIWCSVLSTPLLYIIVFVGWNIALDHADGTPPLGTWGTVAAVVCGLLLGLMLGCVSRLCMPRPGFEPASYAEASQAVSRNPMRMLSMTIGHPFMCMLMAYWVFGLLVLMTSGGPRPWSEAHSRWTMMLLQVGPLVAFLLYMLIALFGMIATAWSLDRERRC